MQLKLFAEWIGRGDAQRRLFPLKPEAEGASGADRAEPPPNFMPIGGKRR